MGMSGVKIQLSPEEQEMAANTGIILTKNRVLASVMEIFGELSAAQVAMAESQRRRLPGEFFSATPKIARGENYLQMPWIMLDYPRHFDAAGTLAIRQFFWWGNFFSVNLQVSGPFKKRVLEGVADWPEELRICVHPSPWEHHYGPDNFAPVSGLGHSERLEIAGRTDFLKLSMAIPLTQWDAAPTFLLNGFSNYLKLLED